MGMSHYYRPNDDEPLLVVGLMGIIYLPPFILALDRKISAGWLIWIPWFICVGLLLAGLIRLLLRRGRR